MIIISQDKRMLINFNNISGVVIRKNNEDSMWQLQCKAEGENKRIIGKYKTEERAKEVLNEFAEFYYRNDYKKALEPLIGIGEILSRANGAFYMPKD